MSIFSQSLWLGTESAFDAACAAELNANKFLATNPQAFDSLQEYIDGQLASVQDGVMVVNIQGSLVGGSAGIQALFGTVGYDDLRRVLLQGMTDEKVKAFLLNVGSGGGAVAGVTDASSLIARINSVKPVVTYTGGMMASAAYWIGSQSRAVYASPTSIVGSIGIVNLHVSRAKELADMGREVTVVRAGSEKMLANPYERLTEAGKAQLQDQADTLYDVFIESVASARGISVKAAEKKFGQGRVFVGQQAVDAGLVDKLGGFDDAFAKAYALGRGTGKMPQGKKPNVQGTKESSAGAVWQNPNQPEGNLMPNPALSAEMLQALAAAGVTVDANGVITAPAADNKPADEDKPADPAADAGAGDTKPVDAAANAGVAELVAQLAAAQAETITAKNATAAAEAALAAANASHSAAVAAVQANLDKATEIVRDSVRTMGLHFGVSKEGVQALSATEVLAEHSRLKGLFVEKFPVGRVTATGAAADGSKQSAAANLTFAEREFARTVSNRK